MNALDPTKFAAAKLNLVLGVGLDAELPKLALRIVSLFVGRHMHAERGGEAWPAIKTLCQELGVSSGSMVREALYALLKRGHLVADRKAGERTRYRIADRYFECGAQPAQEAIPVQIKPAGEPAMQAGGEPEYEAGGEPARSADPQPARQATSTGNRIPGNESRELSTGKDSPSTPSLAQKPASRKNGELLPPPRKTKSLPNGFEEFWNAYPLRVEKLAAETAFKRAVRSGATPEQITAAAKRFAEKRALVSDPAERERYTPYPANWLNRGSWADDLAPQDSTSFDGLPIVVGAPLRRNPREGHGFRIMRVEEFLQ